MSPPYKIKEMVEIKMLSTPALEGDEVQFSHNKTSVKNIIYTYRTSTML